MRTWIGVIVFALFVCQSAQSQVPGLIQYQGRLVHGTNLYNGTVQMELWLYDSASGGTLLYSDYDGAVRVVDGLYATYLGDNTTYGSLQAALASSPLYVEVWVNSTRLQPRERVAAVAYALVAGSVTNKAITTAMLDDLAVTTSKIALNAVNGARISNGSVGTADLADEAVTDDIIADGNVTLADVAPNTFWEIGGNAGISSLTDVMGTVDNTPFELHVNSQRALRLIPSAASPSLLGGHKDNVLTNAAGCVIAGGGIAGHPQIIEDGNYNTIGGGTANRILDADDSVIAGGSENEIRRSVSKGTIGGGDSNLIDTNADYTVIAGGFENIIGRYAFHGVIAGGYRNDITRSAEDAVVGGGMSNTVGLEASSSVIAGGLDNLIGSTSQCSVVSGALGTGSTTMSRWLSSGEAFATRSNTEATAPW